MPGASRKNSNNVTIKTWLTAAGMPHPETAPGRIDLQAQLQGIVDQYRAADVAAAVVKQGRQRHSRRGGEVGEDTGSFEEPSPEAHVGVYRSMLHLVASIHTRPWDGNFSDC